MGIARVLEASTLFSYLHYFRAIIIIYLTKKREIAFRLMEILMGQAVVANAHTAFVRKLYYRHDEMEYGVC